MVDKVGTSMVTSNSMDVEWRNKTIEEVDSKRRFQPFFSARKYTGVKRRKVHSANNEFEVCKTTKTKQ